MNDHLGRDEHALRQRLHLAQLDVWTILSSIVLPIPARLLRYPRARAARRGRPSRGSASPRGGRRGRGRVLALELAQVGQQLELVGDLVVPGSVSDTDSDDTEVRALVCLPTYNERENLEPMLQALGTVLGPDDGVLVIDDNSPDGRPSARRPASPARLPFVEVLHRARKGGLGPAYLAGFRPAGSTPGAFLG